MNDIQNMTLMTSTDYLEHQHHLLSLPLATGYLHALVAANDTQYDAECILAQMNELAAKLKLMWWPARPFVTELPDVTAMSLIGGLHEQHSQLRYVAVKLEPNYRCSMWFTDFVGEDADLVMGLHHIMRPSRREA